METYNAVFEGKKGDIAAKSTYSGDEIPLI